MLKQNNSFDVGPDFYKKDFHSKMQPDHVVDPLEPGVLFLSNVSLVASDTIIPREYIPSLKNAQQVLASAKESAASIIQQANEEAFETRQWARTEGQEWLDQQQTELHAQMHFQQTEWLSRLQPLFVQALERVVRKLCNGEARPDLFASAIEAGLQEFKDLSDLQIHVHPDDFESAAEALERLNSASSLIAVHTDSSVEPGLCRLRNPNFEVTVNLNRAIELALG